MVLVLRNRGDEAIEVILPSRSVYGEPNFLIKKVQELLLGTSVNQHIPQIVWPKAPVVLNKALKAQLVLIS